MGNREMASAQWRYRRCKVRLETGIEIHQYKSNCVLVNFESNLQDFERCHCAVSNSRWLPKVIYVISFHKQSNIMHSLLENHYIGPSKNNSSLTLQIYKISYEDEDHCCQVKLGGKSSLNVGWSQLHTKMLLFFLAFVLQYYTIILFY
jgi:hypothetical protein